MMEKYLNFAYFPPDTIHVLKAKDFPFVVFACFRFLCYGVKGKNTAKNTENPSSSHQDVLLCARHISYAMEGGWQPVIIRRQMRSDEGVRLQNTMNDNGNGDMHLNGNLFLFSNWSQFSCYDYDPFSLLHSSSFLIQYLASARIEMFSMLASHNISLRLSYARCFLSCHKIKV